VAAGASPSAAEDGVSGAIGDDALIARAAGGDRDAWSTLVDRHLGAITGYAWYMLGDRAEAEDVAQETFLRFVRKIGGWQPGGAILKTWLYRVAINLCIDRRRKRVPVPLEEAPEMADTGAANPDEALDRKRQVRAALDHLPERQKKAIVLVYYQGNSNKEVAELLGLSVDAVESLLARARRSLKSRLADVRAELIGDGS
jgi:RNA polymerase sigma-70 factor (ECF subfamily)